MNAGAGHKTLQLEQQRRVASSQEEMAGGKPGTKVTASRSTVVETVGDKKKVEDRCGIDGSMRDSTGRIQTPGEKRNRQRKWPAKCNSRMHRRGQRGAAVGAAEMGWLEMNAGAGHKTLQLEQQRRGGWR